MEVGGSIYVAVGSALLLAASSNLTPATVLIVVAVAGALIHLAMAVRLRTHLKLVEATTPSTPAPSLAWCLAHPLWRP
jgi:hypothetical protein